MYYKDKENYDNLVVEPERKPEKEKNKKNCKQKAMKKNDQNKEIDIEIISKKVSNKSKVTSSRQEVPSTSIENRYQEKSKQNTLPDNVIYEEDSSDEEHEPYVDVHEPSVAERPKREIKQPFWMNDFMTGGDLEECLLASEMTYLSEENDDDDWSDAIRREAVVYQT
ncbi:hypothetical protein ACJJTC_003951 [Scirpophaga incertulas]